MKKQITKFTLLGLLATTLIAVPGFAHAQPADANAQPADQSTTVKPKKHGTLPFRGRLRAVDTNAMTLTVGKRTFEVTADTKIFKRGEPAILAEGVVGELVRGSYKKTEDGRLEAMKVEFGAKTGGKQKKPSSSGN